MAKLTIPMEKEHEKKHSWRYKEIVEEGKSPVLGTAYISNAAVAALGSPTKLTVTLETE